MSLINENFLKLQDSYLFSTIAKKVKEYSTVNPDKKIIKLGIGDITRPLSPTIIKAMHDAVDEMADANTFKGYGPEQGYDFLKKAIIKDYAEKNINIDNDEIFISDGAKCDTGNIVDLFATNNKVAIPDPVYPVYLDTNVMSGRSGNYNESLNKYENVTYIQVDINNNFIPNLPKEKIDIIYLCYPNNPTGTTLNKKELKKWVDYAIKNHSIILFDAAYEAYITEDNMPHSIYEIDGAKDVAIEFKSFSKTAGFTGLRCAYTIIPKNVHGYTTNNEEVSLNKLWNRRTCTKFNGASYISQKAAEATFTKQGKKEIQENINYYLTNAKIIKEGLESIGYKVFGGTNSPYIWFKIDEGLTSWEFFDKLLNEVNIIGTPGSGFGPSGEGYFRLTGFGSKEDTIEAINRLKEWKKR